MSTRPVYRSFSNYKYPENVQVLYIQDPDDDEYNIDSTITRLKEETKERKAIRREHIQTRRSVAEVMEFTRSGELPPAPIFKKKRITYKDQLLKKKKALKVVTPVAPTEAQAPPAAEAAPDFSGTNFPKLPLRTERPLKTKASTGTKSGVHRPPGATSSKAPSKAASVAPSHAPTIRSAATDAESSTTTRRGAAPTTGIPKKQKPVAASEQSQTAGIPTLPTLPVGMQAESEESRNRNNTGKWAR